MNIQLLTGSLKTDRQTDIFLSNFCSLTNWPAILWKDLRAYVALRKGRFGTLCSSSDADKCPLGRHGNVIVTVV